jgi:hypothetical protein
MELVSKAFLYIPLQSTSLLYLGDASSIEPDHTYVNATQCQPQSTHGMQENIEFDPGFSLDTAGHMALIPMRTDAIPGGSQSEPLFTRAF